MEWRNNERGKKFDDTDVADRRKLSFFFRSPFFLNLKTLFLPLSHHLLFIYFWCLPVSRRFPSLPICRWIFFFFFLNVVLFFGGAFFVLFFLWSRGPLAAAASYRKCHRVLTGFFFFFWPVLPAFREALLSGPSPFYNENLLGVFFVNFLNWVFTRLFWVLYDFDLGLARCDWVWLCFHLFFTGYDCVLLGFTGLTLFYLVLLGFTGFYWVLTEFYLVLLGFT